MKILIPVDKSPRDGILVPFAGKMGKRLRASLAVLHVVSSLRSVFPGAIREAEAYAEIVAQGLRDSGLTVDAFYAKGEAAPMILDVADEVGADMIAMATHGRRGMGKLMLGSVAEAVVSLSEIPVLLIKVPLPEEEYGRDVGGRLARAR